MPFDRDDDTDDLGLPSGSIRGVVKALLFIAAVVILFHLLGIEPPPPEF